MECSEVRLKLDEYIKNRLDCCTAERIADHLKGCLSCSEELSLLRELNDILDMEIPACAGSDFTACIMESIDRDRAAAKRFIFNRFPVVNLGASLILAGLLTIFINTPSISNAIVNIRDSMQYGAATVNSSISTTTSDVETYIRNIFNPGGKQQ